MLSPTRFEKLCVFIPFFSVRVLLWVLKKHLLEFADEVLDCAANTGCNMGAL
jgi:hypothetical protein